MKKNIKVVTVVGTRPEVIRLSRVINYLDKNPKIVKINSEVPRRWKKARDE